MIAVHILHIHVPLWWLHAQLARTNSKLIFKTAKRKSPISGSCSWPLLNALLRRWFEAGWSRRFACHSQIRFGASAEISHLFSRREGLKGGWDCLDRTDASEDTSMPPNMAVTLQPALLDPYDTSRYFEECCVMHHSFGTVPQISSVKHLLCALWLVSLTSGGAKNNAHAKRACWVWQERRSSVVQTGKLVRCINQRKRNIINILWSHRGPHSPFNGVNLWLALAALVDFLALLPRNNEVRRGEAVPDTGCTQLALLGTLEWNAALSAWKKSAQHQDPALLVTCWP